MSSYSFVRSDSLGRLLGGTFDSGGGWAPADPLGGTFDSGGGCASADPLRLTFDFGARCARADMSAIPISVCVVEKKFLLM